MLNKFQVKTAMDSFKDSIDSTLASKAEQVATAASQSADLIKKCEQIYNYFMLLYSRFLPNNLSRKSVIMILRVTELIIVKDDLLESFGCLRKDLKENEDLKEIITKVTIDGNLLLPIYIRIKEGKSKSMNASRCVY